jgi:hypothetical protein
MTRGQRAEHYEMVAYGTLVAWTRARAIQKRPHPGAELRHVTFTIASFMAWCMLHNVRRVSWQTQRIRLLTNRGLFMDNVFRLAIRVTVPPACLQTSKASRIVLEIGLPA